ncbi:MAG: isochorismatase family protein [Sedimentisphaerales bacterium]|jgi:nicotinamidase/pyrazinamidase
MKKDVVFWDVDTQYDLMRPEGRLYVPGAEGIIENVNEARHFALENGYSIIAVADWHKEGNKEISKKPDFKTTFPAHCMADTPGSERVGYLGELPIDVVPNEKMSEEELRELLDKKQFHIVVRKEKLEVLSNPNMAAIAEFLQMKKAVIFGVALNLCVRMTVEGLVKRGGIKIYLLRDAVKSLGLKGDEAVLEEFRKKGVEIITVADLEKKF